MGPSPVIDLSFLSPGAVLDYGARLQRMTALQPGDKTALTLW